MAGKKVTAIIIKLAQ